MFLKYNLSTFCKFTQHMWPKAIFLVLRNKTGNMQTIHLHVCFLVFICIAHFFSICTAGFYNKSCILIIHTQVVLFYLVIKPTPSYKTFKYCIMYSFNTRKSVLKEPISPERLHVHFHLYIMSLYIACKIVWSRATQEQKRMSLDSRSFDVVINCRLQFCCATQALRLNVHCTTRS